MTITSENTEYTDLVPTMKLRWLKTTESIDSVTGRYITVLQQCWQDQYGQDHWRDVETITKE